jgi:hypothetical protein
MSTIVAAVGGGNWTVGSTWVGGVAPTAADDVQLSAASGNVTIDTGAVCRSLDCTGYISTLTHTSGVTLTIGDGTAGAGNIILKLVAGMTYTLGSATTSQMSFVSSSATQQTIDFGSKTTGNININNGNYIYSSGHTIGSGSTLTLNAGTLNINGQTCSWGIFISTGSSGRTLTLGAAAITITGVSTAAWSMRGASNATITANTAVITFTGTSPEMRPGAINYNGATFVFTGAGNAYISDAGATFGGLTRTGTASKTDNLRIGGNITVTGTFTVNGNSAINRVFVSSFNTAGVQMPGTSRVITAGAVSVSNADFMDIQGAGAASWNLSAVTGGSGDCGGNSGITFTTPATQTWSGTSGGNWSTNAWTSRVPLPQDNAIINASFGASQTVTADMPRLAASIDFTGATGTPTLNISISLNVFGSITLISAMVLSGANAVSLSGRSTYTLTSAGKTWAGNINVTAPSGTYTLQDSIIITGNFNLQYGTFDANGFNVSMNKANIAATGLDFGTRSVVLGSGTWSLTGTADSSIFVWDVRSTSSLTFSGASATIVFSVATAGTRTFAGGGLIYGTLTYTVAGSTGPLVITGANTFTNINFSDVTNARTLTFPSATTNTITGNFNVNGTAGKLMTINSSTGGSAATLSKASGTVSSDYLSIQDSTATGGAGWYAGTHSTNVSNNTGWIFTAPPAGSSTRSPSGRLGSFRLSSISRL